MTDPIKTARAAEREYCARWLEQYAKDYAARWAGLAEGDAAMAADVKAAAWDLNVATARLRAAPIDETEIQHRRTDGPTT